MRNMRLIAKYNFYSVSVMLLVFVISSVASYFLIKQALTKELDVSLLRVKDRIQTYIEKNHKIPVLNSFDDETVTFEATGGKKIEPYFTTVQKFIREQNKLHISRRLTYLTFVNNQNYLVNITSPLEGTRHMLIAISKIALATIFILICSVLLINRGIMGKLAFKGCCAKSFISHPKNNISAGFLYHLTGNNLYLFPER